jgi:small GTP-binding protein
MREVPASSVSPRTSSPEPIGLKAKVCLVGEEAVGKTSLIHRFVHNVFDASYIRTLGASASKKTLVVQTIGPPVRVDMTILDVMGNRKFLELFREAYFQGARGILAVADLTRRSTLDALGAWIEGTESVVGRVPVMVIGNKSDLIGEAAYGSGELSALAQTFSGEFVLASAKTGDGVEEAFRRLATLVAAHQLGQT